MVAMGIVADIVELYRRAACDLPPDVAESLLRAEREEEGTAKACMGMILENIKIAREERRPICQDTGTPIFWVERPEGMSERAITDAIIGATKKATEEVPLRPNSVNPVTGKNSKNNIGEGVPLITFTEVGKDMPLKISLLLKGGGSENVGLTYKLPSDFGERDIEGVKRCVINAVRRAQGNGCPPGIVGVAFGSPKALVANAALKQFLRRLDDRNPDPVLGNLESDLEKELNLIGIGPMGFGGKSTVLGVKVAAVSRHPASFFVEVAYNCWALRRATVTFTESGVVYGY